MNPYRRQRVQERIREILNVELRLRARDPKLAGVYVTEVEVTADLKLAKVYWRSESLLGQKVVNSGLSRSRGFLRARVAQELDTKFSPDLVFYRDESLERGDKIDDVLQRLEQERLIRERLAAARAAEGEAQPPDDEDPQR
jgi:ribosome-binding factor A